MSVCCPHLPSHDSSCQLGCWLPGLVAAGTTVPISCKPARKASLSSQYSQQLSSSTLPRGQEDICVLCCETIIFAGLICPLSAPSCGPVPGASPLFTPLGINSHSSLQDMPTSDVEHWFQQVVAAVECAGHQASADRGQHAERLEKIYHAVLSALQAGEVRASRARWVKGAVKLAGPCLAAVSSPLPSHSHPSPPPLCLHFSGHPSLGSGPRSLAPCNDLMSTMANCTWQWKADLSPEEKGPWQFLLLIQLP